MAVDFPGVGSFSIEFGLILQTLKNCFKVSIDKEKNSELVLHTIKSNKGILLRNVYLHHLMVYAIFEVLVPGCLAVKSLKAV